MEAIREAQAYVENLERKMRELEIKVSQGGAMSPTNSHSDSNAHMESVKTQGTTVVIKVGTSSLVHPKNGIKLGQVAAIMETVAALRRSNHSVVLVMSGAVGTGAHELGIEERPTTISMKQALAAVGQVRLMRELNSMMATLGVRSAQVLLTYGNLSERSQSLNAQNTMEELFRLGVVPVVNENDTVAAGEELRFGDNDRLSAMVACLINANLLFLLTDVNGLYTANPNVDPNAKRIELVPDVKMMRSRVRTDSGPGSEFSTGGMDSKLQAAQIATRGGVRTIIMAASDVRKLAPFVDECLTSNGTIPLAPFGTVCVESSHPVKGRKRWIQTLPARGKVFISHSAAEAMRMRKTLFAAGVTQVEGKFEALEPVEVISPEPNFELLATGLCNFSSLDLTKIMGRNAEDIAEILGSDAESFAVIDRDNLAWNDI